VIIPAEVTKYDRTYQQLEEFLLFAVVVAGKNSKIQAKKLAEFLLETGVSDPFAASPFDMIRVWVQDGTLRFHLERVKMGQYNRLAKVFENLVNANYDLRTVNVHQLQLLVGLKTSRFFLMHSRNGFRCATLDTHILKWLNEQGIVAPKSTPTNPRKYLELEAQYLAICDARGVSPADLDLEIWKSKRVA
jgi:thermostable 8-oxoguanine DNA glycosylase